MILLHIITTLNLGHMPPHRLSVALPLALIFFSSLHAPAASCSDAKATGNDALAAGQALGTGDKLVSANGKFALGFFQFRQSLSTSSTIGESPGWYLGIWFNKIPVCTAVWVANRERPVTESELKATELKVSRGGHLVIFIANNNTSTESIVVGRPTKVVDSANSTRVIVLKNTGNLATVIVPAKPPHSRKEVLLWQSFDDPTDVSLPTAKIGRNKVTGSNTSLVAKKSLIDPSPGSYCVEIDTDGALQLRTRTPPFVVYWSWAPGKLGELAQAINELIESDPRTKGLLVTTYQDNDEEVYFSYNLKDESVSVFVSIDIYSAQLLLNIWSQATESWMITFTQPSDFCDTYSACGPFTVCNGNLSPLLCGCMEGFYQKSPQDWDLGDRTGGCARATPLDCINGNTNKTNSTDVFHPIAQVTLPFDSRIIGDAATQSDCADACLNDCSCTAYSYNNSKCSIWHGELLNVILDDGILFSSQDVLYLRLAARDFQSLSQNGKRTPRFVIAIIIVGSGLIVLVLFLMIWRNRFKWCNVPLHGIQGSGGIIAFRYTDLCRATKNFSERLGGGGFGSVFRGVLSDSTTIAVKRLDGARQGEKQFRAEVSTIGMIQHINLVKFIGFCCGGDNRLLVYEHMVNGSLDAHLFQSNATVLNWNARYQIALGVARGLCYLHESCRECIIHCDIKPENILLDASFVPKIADFGMAAFVGRDFSRVLTTFRGTAGYLAPEWLSGVAITPRVDVYSFGMVLLEIVSGKRNTPEVHSKSSYHVAYFPVQAISKLHERDLWIPSWKVTSIWKRLKGFAKLHFGASKITNVTGRQWLKWFGFLRVSRSFICPQCQDYLQQ
ncbi:hypothetical protein BS78_09G020900 [Paspalum vaginatum]|nr:hypothetical protein BS78_09G020900 [Paspalum vaginatum]